MIKARASCTAKKILSCFVDSPLDLNIVQKVASGF